MLCACRQVSGLRDPLEQLKQFKSSKHMASLEDFRSISGVMGANVSAGGRLQGSSRFNTAENNLVPGGSSNGAAAGPSSETKGDGARDGRESRAGRKEGEASLERRPSNLFNFLVPGFQSLPAAPRLNSGAHRLSQQVGAGGYLSPMMDTGYSRLSDSVMQSRDEESMLEDFLLDAVDAANDMLSTSHHVRPRGGAWVCVLCVCVT